MAQKSPPSLSTNEAEFDAKHTESSLCACRDCNAAWLARRDQPTALKHKRSSAPAIDIVNKKPYAARCKKLSIEIELKNEHNLRIAHWRLVDPSTSYAITLGFDTDVAAVLARMEHENQALRGAASALFETRALTTVRASNPGALTGGPFCVMCGEPATLFCPNMTKKAQLLGIRLHFPDGDARLGPARLHPGRCRKRLNDLIHAALVQRDNATSK